MLLLHSDADIGDARKDIPLHAMADGDVNRVVLHQMKIAGRGGVLEIGSALAVGVAIHIGEEAFYRVGLHLMAREDSLLNDEGNTREGV